MLFTVKRKKLAKSVLMRKSRPIALYVPPIDSANMTKTSMVARIVLIVANMRSSSNYANYVVVVAFANMGSKSMVASIALIVASMGITRLNANYVMEAKFAITESKRDNAENVVELVIAFMTN